MKHLTIIALAILLTGCINKQTGQSSDKTLSPVSIDSVEVKASALTNLCILIEESDYPKISGIENDSFQKQVNEIFSNNFNSFIESAKSQLASTIPPELSDVYTVESWSTRVGSSFEILTNNDKHISIVQHFSIAGGGGANSWSCSSIITNLDLINGIVLNNSDLKTGIEEKGLVNSRVKSYFDHLFPEEKKQDLITYPVVENNRESDKLKFGLRNDSLVLVIEAMPISQDSYDTYIIPIDLWLRESKTTGLITEEERNGRIQTDLPVKKESEMYPKIACGSQSTILLKEDGTVWTWGNNSFGQIGNGTKNNELSKNDPGNDQLTPIQVPGLEGVSAIATGDCHAGAVGTDGTVWLWGDDSFGQLGDGTMGKHFPQ